MANYTGTASADYIDTTTLTPSGDLEAYFVYGRDGDDKIYGGSKNDFLYGEGGNDQVYGRGGSDNLIGGNGADVLNGGAGDDFLFEHTGYDTLIGGTGNDRMWGCTGNDTYVHNPGDGLDVINDNKTATGGVGGGGTTDVLQFGYLSSEVEVLTDGVTDDLYVTTSADIADGDMNSGVRIENFFLGGNYDIEQIKCLDGTFLL